ncbi:hypothetical protein MMC07_008109 [Pseudocyphellaria aurata]|nr:hypothetical protein [Pseudocyphellaria aurata]
MVTTSRSVHVVRKVISAYQLFPAEEQGIHKTVCPNPGNETCCSAKAGKTEILYHYTAVLPGAKDLTAFYADAGYTIPSSTTSSSGAIASASPTSTALSADGTSALPTSTSSDHTHAAASSEFSIAAKVGIGVSNGVAIVLVAFVVILFLRRQRRKARVRNTRPLPSDKSGIRVEAAIPHEIAEMDGPGRFEIDGRSVPAELGR